MLRASLTALTLAALTGCSSLIPTERHQSQSVQATEAIHTASERTTERTLTTVPEMALAVSRDSNVVAIPLGNSISEVVRVTSSAATGAGSKEKAAGSSITSIPLGVKLLLLGAGIFVLVAALIWAWSYVRSTAIGQGIALADRGFSALVSKIGSSARTTTNPETLNLLNSIIADINDERGKVSNRRK